MKRRMMQSAITGLSLAMCVACGSTESTGGPQAGDPAPGTAQAATDDAARANAANDRNVIARVEIESGHTITFYEMGPGGLFMVETRNEGQTAVIHGSADALDVYARVRPGAAVPDALRAAYGRARDAAANARLSSPKVAPALGGGQPAVEGAPSVQIKDGLGVTAQALTSSSSAANFVDTDHGCDWGETWSFCRVSWGGGFFASTSSDSASCIVDHYAGNGVTVQLTADDTQVPLFQAAGTVVTYNWGFVSGNVTRRIDILNASGDSFHVGCRWTG